jgi:hypothetical protein
MARETKQPQETQPAEDMFGRSTGTRHAEEGTRPREEDACSTVDAQYAKGPKPHDDPDEVCSIDDLPDGDGLRSDLGTNPLPDVYWSAYPGGHKPDDDKH